MGTVKVEIDIGDPHGEHFESVDALVDTDASYTVVPAYMLRRLGIVAMETRPFKLADGSQRSFDIGETRVRIDGRMATTIVVFGEIESETLLGAHALEGLALAVDPLERKLIPVPGLLM